MYQPCEGKSVATEESLSVIVLMGKSTKRATYPKPAMGALKSDCSMVASKPSSLIVV